ncbi:hypothetical protein AX16_009097 [Volvariella volvacea WC 439]|nr:hypothetical protein AX16_009097 [Volvariella volvacea WC 439]
MPHYTHSQLTFKKSLSKSPYEARSGLKPDVLTLRPWGTPVIVHTTAMNKLAPQETEGCWISYDLTLNGNRIYRLKDKKVTVEWNFKFLEDRHVEGEQDNDLLLLLDDKDKEPTEDPTIQPTVTINDANPPETEPIDPLIIIGKRAHKQTQFYGYPTEEPTTKTAIPLDTVLHYGYNLAQ